MTEPGLIRPIHAPAIELTRFKAVHKYVPDIASSMKARIEPDVMRRFRRFGRVEKIESHTRRIMRKNREIDTVLLH